MVPLCSEESSDAWTERWTDSTRFTRGALIEMLLAYTFQKSSRSGSFGEGERLRSKKKKEKKSGTLTGSGARLILEGTPGWCYLATPGFEIERRECGERRKDDDLLSQGFQSTRGWWKERVGKRTRINLCKRTFE